MSDYPGITNQELDEDIEVICNVASCKTEAKLAVELYVEMIVSGQDVEQSFYKIIASLKGELNEKNN